MKKINYNFKDRTAVITGGAQGFGLDIAKRFLDSGANVIIWDMDAEMTDKAVKDLNNPNLSSNKIDVSNFKEVQECTNEILKKTNIDILINNAGITGPTAALWEYDIYINGEKVGSSLLDLDEYNYQFNKKNRSYDIDKNLLKIGGNTILIRILGYASLGQVKLKNNNKNDVDFLKNWKVKLLAEETLQIESYFLFISLLFFHLLSRKTQTIFKEHFLSFLLVTKVKVFFE